MKIKEVIVVEGKHDAQKIKSCVDADIEITSGTHLSSELLSRLKILNETQGIIVFTDPDGPGEMIRYKIIETVGTCKHASLSTKQSRNKNKIGIEHASCEDIVQSLEKCVTYDVSGDTLLWHDFVDLGLMGQKDSQLKRNLIATEFNMPVANAKRCFQYLNMMHKTKEDILEVLKGA